MKKEIFDAYYFLEGHRESTANNKSQIFNVHNHDNRGRYDKYIHILLK
jgi:hypothetical protein